jgi:hypothetical protein
MEAIYSPASARRKEVIFTARIFGGEAVRAGARKANERRGKIQITDTNYPN